MSRFGLPGGSPSQPLTSGGTYSVFDPVTELFVGRVVVAISADGLTTMNTTLPGHLLEDGAIIRTATQNPDGSWTVTTTGVGNNIYSLFNKLNEVVGPNIFRGLDQNMIRDIQLYHGGS